MLSSVALAISSRIAEITNAALRLAYILGRAYKSHRGDSISSVKVNGNEPSRPFAPSWRDAC
jgi:hypothetical protein